MSEDTIIISSLPREILSKIPLSIRTLKDEYKVSELPPKEQELIKNYLKNIPNINYNVVYDIVPSISQYADLSTLQTISELLKEYLKNYFYTNEEDYPFDPFFGCRLKKNLQTRDTHLRKLLIHEDIKKIVDILNKDLNFDIVVEKVGIDQLEYPDHSEYNCIIEFSVSGETIKINYSYSM